MVSDERVDELAQIAAQLAARIRDDKPNDIAGWLARVAPTAEDHCALMFILAAAVPIGVPFAHLTAWARVRDVEHQELVEHRRAILTGSYRDDLGAAA